MFILVLEGDNVVGKSEKIFWFDGMLLMEMLENIEIGEDDNFEDFCFLV